MENSLDMSLEDLIKSKHTSQRGRGRGRNRQGQRRGRTSNFTSATGGFPKGHPSTLNVRPSAFAIAKTFSKKKNVTLQHGYLEDSLVAAGYSGSGTGTKLYVSNLDLGVSNDDIKELFSEIGKLKHYALHYDRNGRSTGSAEVVFTNSADALAAMRRYNNVQLDGKLMKIEIIGTNLPVPVTPRVNVVGRGRRTVVMTPGPGGFSRGRASSAPFNRGNSSSSRVNRGESQRGRGQSRGGGGGREGIRGRGRGRGRGGGRGRKEGGVEKSLEELNKELDNYHLEAMQTS